LVGGTGNSGHDDVNIINGQSKALAKDYYNQASTYPDFANYTSAWVRTYGSLLTRVSAPPVHISPGCA